MTDHPNDDKRDTPQPDDGTAEPDQPAAQEQQAPRKKRNRKRRRRSVPGGKGNVAETSTRHQARTIALQSLYEYDLTGHEQEDLHQRIGEDDDVPPSVREYAQRLFAGVLSQLEPIDGHIGEAAPAFPVGQLSAVDRNVLRIAVYELTHERRTVPERVAINEAIELAKHYGSENSSRFVHGVLGTISRRIPGDSAESAR